MGKDERIIKVKCINKIRVCIDRHLIKIAQTVPSRPPDNDRVKIINGTDRINDIFLNSIPQNVVDTVRFVQYLVIHQRRSMLHMFGNLFPNRHKNRKDRGRSANSGIEAMIIKNDMKIQFFSPINRLIEKFKEERVDSIVWASVRHPMQIDRQTNDITSKKFDIFEISLCIF